MKTTLTTTLLLFLFISIPAKARDVFFSVETEAQSFYLISDKSANLYGRLSLMSKGEQKINSKLSFKLDASIDSTYFNKQDRNQKVLFNPKQFGLALTTKKLDLQLGGFTLNPEGADLNNIFDVIHGKDFRNPFNSKSIGSLGALVTFPWDPATLKLFYIPKNTRSILPDTQSAWWPRTDSIPIRNSSGTFNLPKDINYYIKSESEYEKPFDNNFGASLKTSFSLFDLHLFYYSGANQIPKISPDFTVVLTSYDPLVGDVQSPVGIDLNWFRSEHAGVGATFVMYDWIGKTFCKQQTDYLPVKEVSPSCTFSLESSFSIGRASIHYFLQSNRVWRDTSSVRELETLLGFFEKSTALGYLVDLEAKGILSGAFVYNEKNPSWLASLGYEYRITDQFRSKINVNQIFSTNDVVGKAYDKTDNASLTMTYDF